MTSTSERPRTLRELYELCDGLAVADPQRYGHGYHESQFAWAYDPAFELGRQTLFELLREIVERELNGTFLQLGLGRRGGLRRILERIARRVVSVEVDAGRIRSFLEREPGTRCDDLLFGDSTDPSVVSRVSRSVGSCDFLIIDADDSFESVRADWQAYASLVRPGGIVAIVDASQARSSDGRGVDVDRCVLELGAGVLAPCGVELRRIGNDRVVHWYVQPATPPDRAIPIPAAMPATPHAERVGSVDGLALWRHDERTYAIPDRHTSFDPRRIAESEYAVVVPLDRAVEPAAAARSFVAAEAALTCSRQLLLRGDVDGARTVARTARREDPELRARLLDALAVHPYSRRAVLAIGTLGVLTDDLREGRAWLEAALERDVTDAELLQMVAAVQLKLDRDEAAARSTIELVQRRLDASRLRAVCAELLGASPGIWRYPQLIDGVRGVIQVGAGRGEEVDAFTRAGFTRQLYLEPDPSAFETLQRACARHDGVERDVHCVAIGAQSGGGVLLHADGNASGSLLEPRIGTREPGASVDVTTLDELVGRGSIDPGRYELLVVDAEGAELDVLRGATELLPHLDVLCVSVFYEPTHDGGATPAEIRDFVARFDDFGFRLRAHDPEQDPRRGNAIFTRGTRRRTEPR